VTDSSDREGHSAGDAREGEGRDESESREDRDRSFRRLGDSLISSIWGDSSAAFKRGQGLVTGVAQGTKEELVRMISAEVRGFLDKMDAADLVQEIVSGLVIEMKTEIRFRRSEDGKLEPEVRTSEAKLGHEEERKSETKRRPPKSDAKPDEE
jgi:hypothetical protein